MSGHARHASLLRLLRLNSRVQDMRYAPSLHQLAAEFQCSARTIRRDLELLERAGLPAPVRMRGGWPAVWSHAATTSQNSQKRHEAGR